MKIVCPFCKSDNVTEFICEEPADLSKRDPSHEGPYYVCNACEKEFWLKD